jgi:hypothetical protein
MESNSGYQSSREYLGMSKLSDCPRKVVREVLTGIPASDLMHRMSMRGYAVQNAVTPIYEKAGLIVPGSAGKEIVAEFTELKGHYPFRGHVDGVLAAGNGILEIKSVTAEKFNRRREVRKADPNHYKQVQAYMHFGHYQECVLVYWNVETFEDYPLFLTHYPQVGYDLEAKAVKILKYIGLKELPDCECGLCRTTEPDLAGP